MNFNYTEYHGRLYISTKNENFKQLDKGEAKKASIDSYGSGNWGKLMQKLGFAVQVTGQSNKTYYVKKKSYEDWLRRVVALDNVKDLTVENMKSVAIENVKAVHLGDKEELASKRYIESDIAEIFRNKESYKKQEFENKEIEKYQSSIDRFTKEIEKNRTTPNISFGVTRETIGRLGYEVRNLLAIVQVTNRTTKDKLIALRKFEETQKTLDNSLKTTGITDEKDRRFILRTAILLAGGGIALKMIQELPPKEKLNLDSDLSDIYDDYKKAADCIINPQKWPMNIVQDSRSKFNE